MGIFVTMVVTGDVKQSFEATYMYPSALDTGTVPILKIKTVDLIPLTVDRIRIGALIVFPIETL